MAKELFVHPDGDDAVPYAVNDRNNPWKSPYRGFKGSNNGNAPNPAEAGGLGDVMHIAHATYDIVDAAINYFGPNSGRRYLPLLQPVNPGLTVFGNNSLMVNRDDSLGQPILGFYNTSINLFDFQIDENLARATPDTGPFVTWGWGAAPSRCERIRIRGLVDSQGNPVRSKVINGVEYNYQDNHNLWRGEGMRGSIFRDIVLRDSWQAGRPHNNGAAAMFYGCYGNLIERVVGHNLDVMFSFKGTVDDTDVDPDTDRDHNAFNILRYFRIIGTNVSSVVLDSAHDMLIEHGMIENSQHAGIAFKQTNNSNAPKRVVVRNVGFANCSSDFYFNPNASGGYENIRLEVQPGTRVTLEGNDNTGWLEVVPYLGDAQPLPERPTDMAGLPIPLPVAAPASPTYTGPGAVEPPPPPPPPPPAPVVRAPAYTGGRRYLTVDGITGEGYFTQEKEAYEAANRVILNTPTAEVVITTDPIRVTLE